MRNFKDFFSSSTDLVIPWLNDGWNSSRRRNSCWNNWIKHLNRCFYFAWTIMVKTVYRAKQLRVLKLVDKLPWGGSAGNGVEVQVLLPHNTKTSERRFFVLPFKNKHRYFICFKNIPNNNKKNCDYKNRMNWGKGFANCQELIHWIFTDTFTVSIFSVNFWSWLAILCKVPLFPDIAWSNAFFWFAYCVFSEFILCLAWFSPVCSYDSCRYRFVSKLESVV